jgi:exopolysaccharide biosynthesis operon protein EpsL
MSTNKSEESVLKNLPIRPLLALTALCAGQAAFGAEPTDVFQLRASAGVEHDDNVERAHNGGTTDQIGILSVGLAADKRIGLQRLRADVEATTYRYQDVDSLNYNTINYALALDWSITPRFHGVASADRRQTREVTTDSVTLVNRVGRRTERNELLEGVYEAGPWRLLGGVQHTRSESTEPRSWDASPKVRSARVGVGYELASGTSLTARLRRGDGEYTDPTPGAPTGDFNETETDVVLKWPLTGKTAVEARLGHLEREHDIAPQMDFSGWVGGASVAWEITGKTRLVAGVSHDLVASGLFTGGHVEADRIYLQPTWQATAKTAVNLRYDRGVRRWKDVPVVSPDQGRRDVVEYISAGVDWEARRNITVSSSLRREKLDTSLPSSSYSASIFAVAVKAKF